MIAALLALVLAQDHDRITLRKDDKTLVRTGLIKSLTCDEVKFAMQMDDNRTLNQTEDADDVESIEIADSRKSIEFLQAEDEMNDGNFEAAGKTWLRAMDDLGGDPVLRQVALYGRAVSLMSAGKIDEAITAYRTFKSAIPDTYYLRNIYVDLYECLAAKGDDAATAKMITEFENDGSRRGKRAWTQHAKLLRADLLERQDKFEEALRIYNTFSRERGDIGEMSLLGELRCLSETQNFPSLKTKAESIIRDGRKNPFRVLCAAFNAIGDVERQKENNVKNALMAYLRGICEFQRYIAGSAEHEYSLAMSAMTMREYGNTLPEEDRKDEYRTRAMHLLRELQIRYPRSDHLKPVREVVEKR